MRKLPIAKRTALLALASTAIAVAYAQAAAAAEHATPPAQPNPRGAIELGLFPSVSPVWLHCACALASTNETNSSSLSLGGGVTVGYRYGGFLLSAYGEFGRSVDGIAASHSAIGALGQFALFDFPRSLPMGFAARVRLFHDAWGLPTPPQMTNYLAGFGVGFDAVIGTTRAEDHPDKALGWEVIVGGDVSDLGTFSDISGPSDTDAYATRVQLSLRLTVDTRLGLPP